MCGSVNMKCPEKASLYRQKVDEWMNGCLRLRVETESDW